MLRSIASLVVASLLAASTAIAQDLTVVSWNVEDAPGESDPAVIGRVVRDLNGVDLWGFSEVRNDANAARLEAAAEAGENADFRRIVGTTGGLDRLVIVYDAQRFELVGSEELDEINIGNSVRAPLVAHLRIRTSGSELLFMVNHLYRGSAEGRHEQARLLNDWAAGQTLPIVAVGDYNFDWSVTNGDANHDAGYDELVADGVFTWVRPTRLVKSQCSFNSVLDFVFLAGGARQWQASSAIRDDLSRCPDDSRTSDHRPVIATLTFATPTPPPPPPPSPTTKDELLRRLDALEAEVRALRELVRRLP